MEARAIPAFPDPRARLRRFAGPAGPQFDRLADLAQAFVLVASVAFAQDPPRRKAAKAGLWKVLAGEDGEAAFAAGYGTRSNVPRLPGVPLPGLAELREARLLFQRLRAALGSPAQAAFDGWLDKAWSTGVQQRRIRDDEVVGVLLDAPYLAELAAGQILRYGERWGLLAGLGPRRCEPMNP